MAKKRVYGLTSVLLGPIAVDGGMGATLTEVLGATAKGTASLIYTPPTIADIETEETDDIDDQIVTAPGKWELKLESYNVSAKSMGDTMGGEYTAGVDPLPDTWESPDTIVQQEGSAKVTTRTGVVIEIPRLKYLATPTFALTKNEFGKISLMGTALKPTKAATASLKFTDAPA